MIEMEILLSGAVVMACALIGLVFLKFWRSSRDSLFVYFALSFWLQGGQWLYAGLLGRPNEDSAYAYVPRLIAYGLIAYAILSRNMWRRDKETGG
jgi:hypothetical protein